MPYTIRPDGSNDTMVIADVGFLGFYETPEIIFIFSNPKPTAELGPIHFYMFYAIF